MCIDVYDAGAQVNAPNASIGSAVAGPSYDSRASSAFAFAASCSDHARSRSAFDFEQLERAAESGAPHATPDTRIGPATAGPALPPLLSLAGLRAWV